jgi:TonB family protein
MALGLGSVPVLCSSRLAGPVVIGARRAAIILPANMFEESSAEDLTATLCHEMAHVRRHDFLMNLVYELSYLFIAFHPAGMLIKRRIDQTRELACDEMAAGCLVSSSAYARSLVNLARIMFHQPPASPAATLGVFDADILEERVMRLLDKKRRASPRVAKLALAGVLSSLAFVGTGATQFSLGVTEKSPTAMPDGPHPDFSGHWNLDKTRSTLPSPSPDDLVEVIDHRDPQLRITTTSKDWSGDFWQNTKRPIALTLFALTIPEWVATTDGVERSEKYGPAELKSKTHWEGERLITTWSLERDGRAEITGEWVRSLSPDGRTQSLEVQAHDPQRNAKGEAKLVFVKSSGNSTESFVGTWQAEFQGKTFIVVELRRGNDTLTGTMSPFTVELDGAGNLTKAERGDHGGWDVVEAALDQNGLALKCKDRETGDIDRFQMRLIGEKEALLSPVGAPAPPEGPQPFRLRRVSDQAVVGIRGGVRGGVSSGVQGGVGDGVRGGVVRAASQSVKSDPPEGKPGISGTVSDPSGARVPNVVVNVMNDSSVVKRTTVTDDAGEFAFALLPPGRYQLEAIGAGFALYHERISVPAGEGQPQLNVVLQPGSMAESVEVTAKAAPGTRPIPQKAAPRRIRVGGLVQAGKLIEQKKPEYPEKARLRGSEGVVLLEAVISMEGTPLNWKVLNSPDPDLSEAAINAVREWRYQPTLLNGEPIEIVTTIAVRFRLEDATVPDT